LENKSKNQKRMIQKQQLILKDTGKEIRKQKRAAKVKEHPQYTEDVEKNFEDAKKQLRDLKEEYREYDRKLFEQH